MKVFQTWLICDPIAAAFFEEAQLYCVRVLGVNKIV